MYSRGVSFHNACILCIQHAYCIAVYLEQTARVKVQDVGSFPSLALDTTKLKGYGNADLPGPMSHKPAISHDLRLLACVPNPSGFYKLACHHNTLCTTNRLSNPMTSYRACDHRDSTWCEGKHAPSQSFVAAEAARKLQNSSANRKSILVETGEEWKGTPASMAGHGCDQAIPRSAK